MEGGIPGMPPVLIQTTVHESDIHVIIEMGCPSHTNGLPHSYHVMYYWLPVLTETHQSCQGQIQFIEIY